MFFTKEHRFLTVIFICFCLTLALQRAYAQKTVFISSSPGCGLRDIIPGDALTETPWVASIFAITKPSAPYKFSITATIIGPSTILTLFGGSYGNPPRGAAKDYHIYQPQNVYAAAGINTTHLEGFHVNVQIREISYILPYKGHDADNKEFHYFLYHLKTPFDFSSPYVRAVCLPPPIDVHFNNLPSRKWEFIQGGFSFSPENQNAPYLPLEAFNVTSIPEEQCTKAFRYYYKRTGSSHLFCARRSPGVIRSDSCFLHGSPIVYEMAGRWMLAGITALIPGRKRGRCNKDTLYMYSKTFQHFDWMIKSMECGPKHFACDVDSTCVPLRKVCNGVVNCPSDNSDEDPIFCDATFRCSSKENEVSCGFNGNCIQKTELCNKKIDCDDGSDEHEARCSAPPKPKNVAVNVKKNSLEINTQSSNTTSACYAIPPSEGVVRTCFTDIEDEKVEVVNCDNAKVGSWMTLRCEDFYVSKYRIKSIQMQCQENGLWHPFKPFDCEANCGVLSSDVSPLISNGADATKKEAFPWHAALFKRTETENDYRYICGASLIEKSELFTAGHCVSEIYANPKAAKLFKVVLAPVSSNYEENKNDAFSKIFDIKRVWVPPTFDSRSLNSDIAIIQLTKPTIYGNYIRPVCYLNSGTFQPHLQEIGKVAGFGRTETGEISHNLKYTSLPVVEKEKCVQDSGSETIILNTFCAGNNNETTLCQGDSGNGLVFGEKKASVTRYTLKGITSSGYGRQAKACGKSRFSVFTHVDAFNNWIYEVLENFSD